MAKPRVFISSTFYDLKHIRSSLDSFINSIGFEAILSEKGDIAYSPDNALDESCYREASNADIFVLIVGGRYGSEVSSQDKKRDKDFYDNYESITKKEFMTAIKADIPTYILVESAVFSEYKTYQKNRDATGIIYAHVDSINIFRMLDEVLGLRRNNPVKAFEKATDIEYWLREQWAGLFKDFLDRRSQEKQISSLEAKIEELGEINTTLRRYIEAMITKLSPSESKELIGEETTRLKTVKAELKSKATGLLKYLESDCQIATDVALNLISKSESVDELISLILKTPQAKSQELKQEVLKMKKEYRYETERDFKVVKELLSSP